MKFSRFAIYTGSSWSILGAYTVCRGIYHSRRRLLRARGVFTVWFGAFVQLSFLPRVLRIRIDRVSTVELVPLSKVTLLGTYQVVQGPECISQTMIREPKHGLDIRLAPRDNGDHGFVRSVWLSGFCNEADPNHREKPRHKDLIEDGGESMG